MVRIHNNLAASILVTSNIGAGHNGQFFGLFKYSSKLVNSAIKFTADNKMPAYITIQSVLSLLKNRHGSILSPINPYFINFSRKNFYKNSRAYLRPYIEAFPFHSRPCSCFICPFGISRNLFVQL